MALINLRPWREARKAAQQKQFVTNVAGAAIFAAVVVLGIGYYVDMQTERQNVRNKYLQSEIAKLDILRKEIQELDTKRARLLDRLQAIHELQGNRPVIVRNFDELVRVLPDGIHYTSLTRRESMVSVTGLAEDNTEVSTLMRKLDQSDWFGEPNLSQVDSQDGMKNFRLTVHLEKPGAEEAEQ
ncbi:PilN domain-containing protein [Pontibacterium granulatum]|uniref:PilN domain-containing protein n=1 Tax=Pontibacterium granulatum TaxID=2036029 RepID=UPI00249A0EF3|nr:PilN domain-containing protein [Pontibacterium granulatum]MDI3324692.1 PilN domain-containing protein [Pontibacterium granulatum]